MTIAVTLPAELTDLFSATTGVLGIRPFTLGRCSRCSR